jgi:hypothetical protein
MGDAHLRELERRWCATGSAEHEAELLRTLVQTGALEAERLALAAHCGHPAALLIVPARQSAEANLRDWALELERWREQAWIRVAIAAARSALGPAPRGLARRAIALAEDYALQPSSELSDRALGFAVGRRRPEGRLTVRAAFACAASITDVDPTAQVAEAMRAAIGVLGVGKVRAAVRDEVVPWALGRGDPVAERVRARA